MVGRISSASIFDNAISTFRDQQVNLADLTRQISSGNKYATFTQLGAGIRRVQELEGSFRRTEQYIENNQVTATRLQAMENALSDLIEVGNELQSNLVLRRSAAGSSVPLSQIAKNMLQQVTQSLNSSLEGRFLFSGGKTDTAPVGDIETTSNIVGTAATANYYNGDALKFTARVSDSLSLEYGVTADDTSFQNLVAALHRAIDGDTGNDDTLLASAVDDVNKAIDGIVALRSSVSNNRVAVSDASDGHYNFLTFLNDALGSETSVDVAEASIRIAESEAVLQAAFQGFARITNLNLGDFLR